MAHRIKIFKPLHKERASSGPFRFQGSMTLETALAFPIFLAAICAFVCLLEIADIRMNIYMGLWTAARETAQEVIMSPVLSDKKIEQTMVRTIGEGRLNRSMIEGGQEGLDCGGSRISHYDGIIHLKVSYRMNTPLPGWLSSKILCEDSLDIKGWTGYRGGVENAQGEETLVYITETGSVYHTDYSCTYLNLSVQPVAAEEVEGIRNESGGKYYPCSSCTKKYIEKGVVYVTSTGNRYHLSLQCSKLKRKIYTVPLREVAGKGVCSKCTK
ncbi:pilus assembly protein [Lachnoclostridium sp. An181]|uniref:pilus assembly protein n=1 Tax=Lachnoclostridium sp. An181 TaxID=1965575 RepID=UPI001179A02C|nr:pilus assembly protein [Lachnoclostridium sp. An181]